jgi:signal transduction histidine kinase
VFVAAKRGSFFLTATRRRLVHGSRWGRLFQAARWRLVAWNVLVLIVILGVIELAVYGYFNQNVYAEVDQQLQTMQSRLLLRLAQSGETPYIYLAGDQNLIVDPYRAVVANPQGQIDLSTDCQPNPVIAPNCPSDYDVATSPDALRKVSDDVMHNRLTTPNDIRIVRFRGQPWRVITFAAIGSDSLVEGIVQISRTVEPELTSLHQLRQLLITGTLLGIFASIFGSFFLASRALIPIRQAFARQRQFTADASHELRTPLALIRANAEMLCRRAELLPPEDAELIPEIIHETDHLNRLISNLLTLARADAEVAKIAALPVDLQALVSGVHEDLQHIAESRRIESALTMDGSITVHGDETRLRQLLLILLDNALKYTDPGGRVDVALERLDGRARIVISDTGIGIPARDLPHIFDRFYRVDRAREHASGGTGLGLAIAQWIVQAHHGVIRVESDLGSGTRFQVDLPAK